MYLPGEKTNLYPITRKFIEDEWVKLKQKQITPWSFLTSGKIFSCKYFNGKEITYQGGTFEGSPRYVFWERYIEPFLEDISVRVINETVKLCHDKDQELEPALRETAALLNLLIKNTYNSMVDVDQRLRGKGTPENVEKRNVSMEISAMEDFVESLIKAELAMWKRPSKFQKFREKHPIIIFIIPHYCPE